MRLENRTAAVTGAGRGIGRAVALAFAHEGARVVINDADVEAAASVADEVRAIGAEAAVDDHPIGSMAAGVALVDAAVERFGGLDVLVNNAGVLRDRMAHTMSEEEWDTVVDVHLKGTFACSQAAIRLWRPLAKQEAATGVRRHRKIINVTSLSGLRGSVGQANYAAAKMGIVGLTKTLARELGPLSINVNAIAPSAVTRMTDGLEEKAFAHLPAEERPIAARMLLEQIALRRRGEPEEIAPAFVFLASGDADFITGQVLNVDGGWNI